MTKLVLAAMLCSSAALAADSAGTRLWKAKCAQCHGTDGRGQTKQGTKMGISDLTRPEWQKEWTDQKIKDTLSTGIKRERDGKKQEMDPVELSAEDLASVIAQIRSLEVREAAAKK